MFIREGEYLFHGDNFIKIDYEDGIIFFALISKNLYFQLNIEYLENIENIYHQIDNLSVHSDNDMETYYVEYQNNQLYAERIN